MSEHHLISGVFQNKAYDETSTNTALEQFNTLALRSVENIIALGKLFDYKSD